MPPKRAKGNKLARNSVSKQSTNEFPSVATATGRTVSFSMTQTTSGMGSITQLTSQDSGLANDTFAPLTPFVIGGRCGFLASEFAQWRVKRMTIQYITNETTSGGVDDVTGAATGLLPQVNRAFAYGWGKDPSLTTEVANAFNVIEYGGFQCTTSRNGRKLVLPSSGWLWTSTISSSPTDIDWRMCAHGVFYSIYNQASTTNSRTYGRFEVCFDVEYRFPSDHDPIGLRVFLSKSVRELNRSYLARFPLLNMNRDEKKEDATKDSASGSRSLVNPELSVSTSKVVPSFTAPPNSPVARTGGVVPVVAVSNGKSWSFL
jgi:hypothetical protein